MNVTLIGRPRCPACSCRGRSFCFASVRVNKQSLRTTAPSLVAGDHRCPECGFEMVVPPDRWVLDQKSQKLVDETRDRRGWAA